MPAGSSFSETEPFQMVRLLEPDPPNRRATQAASARKAV
ncbi:hypothetical protein SGF_02686 [Shigella flexneri CDC 796-83]|uniref:Uncharacterized protein n=1 Tax=Shigella flexneri CDC 796-83 TaxID=945360 RepID=A0A6N3QKL5_SHIFL|nr:hypothetical protein SGF_02686 [Shigella flexneri CDC 796-83]EIQ57909.1 hypothetical protein SD22575_3243 [Shigella dysenteriae 225-75]